MSDFVKGFVSAKLATVSVNFVANHTPKTGTQAGESQGPTLFINKGTAKKQQFSTAKEALETCIKDGDLPKATKVYANGEKMTLPAAAKLDLNGFQFWNSKYSLTPKWNVQFMTDAFAKAKNAAYAQEEAATPAKAKAAPAKATKNLPLF
tara:strand:- start:323 stop:772 length:450 start_codon:yes stop_codon:yes gene_type:complete